MANPIPYPLINGIRHGFSSIELKVGDQIIIGFKSINYNASRSRTAVYGNHPDPIGWTRGTNEYKADLEMYLAEFNLLQQKLGKGWQDVPFTVLSTYGENGFDTITDELQGCHFDEVDVSNSQGNDPLTRKVTLNPLKIVLGGLENNEKPLGPPPGG